jgi:hypothetical protein
MLMLGLAPLIWAFTPSRIELQLARLERVSDGDLPKELQAFAYEGTSGLVALANLLNNSRAAVATGAQVVLSARLEELLHDAPASEGVATLAKELARMSAQFSMPGRNTAAIFAQQIIAGQRDASPSAKEILFNCEKIVRQTLRRPSAEKLSLASAKSSASAESDLVDLLANTADSQRGILPAELPRPKVSAELPTDQRRDENPPRTSRAGRSPREPRRFGETESTESDSAPSDDGSRTPTLTPGLQQQGAVSDYRPNTTPTDAFNGASIDPLERETLRLMEQLRGGGTSAAAAAETLRKRGFSERHLELAKMLVSPSVETRRSLAAQLPRERGIDRQVWLLWLARDSAAEVRLAALATLATSADPGLHSQVLQMATTDSDEQIQRLAERLRGTRTPSNVR